MSASRAALVVVLCCLFLAPAVHGAEQAVSATVPAALDTATPPPPPVGASPDEAVEADPVVNGSAVESKVETVEDVAEEGAMPGGIKHVTLTNRVGFGMVGPTMFFEYGFQAEIASRHLGIKLHWAYWDPIENLVGLSFSLGFGFHYYPFGAGPNGLYVGPGFQFTNISRNPDPMREAQRVIRNRLVQENLAANPPQEGARMPPADPVDFGMIINHRTGVGRQFNLLTPMVEVGYRHSWPERESPAYFTLGIEAMVGYAVSDVVNYWDSGFTFTLNPQMGITW